MPEIQIQAGPEDLKGRYSNFMQVAHNKEEFVMDFLNVFPPAGSMVARVITSPGHLKRIIKALEQNLGQYESKFGKVEEAEVPQAEIGFKA
jgi:hypothetical protein